MTRLLLDTDVFCKLGVAGLLEDTLSVFGVTWSDCYRLPALPHMLCRGGLVRRHGVEPCHALVAIARAIPELPTPDQEWLGELADLSNIDVGEAQLYAVAAGNASLVLSGDKRALRTLCNLERFHRALDGRIVVFEAILIALCGRLGIETVRSRVKSLAAVDNMIAACFSETNSDPIEALWSYFQSLGNEVLPLTLWSPKNGVAS